MSRDSLTGIPYVIPGYISQTPYCRRAGEYSRNMVVFDNRLINVKNSFLC